MITFKCIQYASFFMMPYRFARLVERTTMAQMPLSTDCFMVLPRLQERFSGGFLPSCAGARMRAPNSSHRIYFGSTAAAEAKLPFPAGCESVGVVSAAAADVHGLVVGQPCATMVAGFAKWVAVAAKHVFSLPKATPEMVGHLRSCPRAPAPARRARQTAHACAAAAALAACRVGCPCSPACLPPPLHC
jgi:hypothetical protein